MLVAVFALQLGLDNDPGWGRSRYVILLVGLSLVLLGAYDWIEAVLGRIPVWGAAEKWLAEAKLRAGSLPFFIHWRDSGFYRFVSKNKTDLGLILWTGLILWIYAWIATIGSMSDLPSGKGYYWRLAQAFRQGQTHLLVEPDPALLALENPYDYKAREDIKVLWDSTFYDGKYYIYWGPLPGVLALGGSWLTGKPVTDTALALFFLVGTTLFSLLILRKSYREYHYPASIFWGGVFAASLNIPLAWILTRPNVYEVSVTGGQFFLVLGLWGFFHSLHREKIEKRYLVLTATAFGFAGATRINLLPSIVFLGLLLFLWVFIRHQKQIAKSFPDLLAAGLPLASVAGALLWYNYDRFGKILEFGHRYQLTGPALPQDYTQVSSLKYILPNFYTYFVRLPDLQINFPFVRLTWIKEEMWPFFIRIPEHYYYSEPVAGLPIIVPVFGVALLFLARYVWLWVNGDLPKLPQNKIEKLQKIRWLAAALLGYLIIQTAILLIFIYAATRYLYDIAPVLILFATLLLGVFLSRIAQSKFQARLVTFLWLAAGITSALLGFFIGFTGERNNFMNQNPAIYEAWLRWFGG